MAMPESGFYSWINVSALGNSTDISNYLIEKASVAVNDGKTYGYQGDGYIRVIHGSYKDDDRAIKVLENIKKALTEFPK
jgi:aspartate/methionine/tyrosine aminotransferase